VPVNGPSPLCAKEAVSAKDELNSFIISTEADTAYEAVSANEAEIATEAESIDPEATIPVKREPSP
jgi:hypothetical protein